MIIHIGMLTIIVRHSVATTTIPSLPPDSLMMVLLIAENNSKVEAITCSPAAATTNCTILHPSFTVAVNY